MKNIKNIIIIVLGVMFINTLHATVITDPPSKVGGKHVVTLLQNEDSGVYVGGGYIFGINQHNDRYRVSSNYTNVQGYKGYLHLEGGYVYDRFEYTKIPLMGNNLHIGSVTTGLRLNLGSKVHLMSGLGPAHAWAPWGNKFLGKLQLLAKIDIGPVSIMGGVDSHIDFTGTYLDKALPDTPLRAENYNKWDFLSSFKIEIAFALFKENY